MKQEPLNPPPNPKSPPLLLQLTIRIQTPARHFRVNLQTAKPHRPVSLRT